MTTPHKDANLLIAIAHGKQMQVEGITSPWADASPDRALVAICAGEPCRVKPDFVLVNGVECPKPVIIGRCTVRLMILNEGKFWDTFFDNLSEAETVCRAMIKPFKECQE